MINLASPIVGVPFRVFIIALAAGHLPINFISVKARPASLPLPLLHTRGVCVCGAAGRRRRRPAQLRSAPRPARKPEPPCCRPTAASPQAGHNLATMQSVSDMYSARNVLVLACAASLALVPVLLRRLRRGDRAARGHAHPSARAVQVVSLLPIVAHAGPGGGAAAAARSAAGGGSIAVIKQQLGNLGVGGVQGLSPAAKRVEGQHVL